MMSAHIGGPPPDTPEKRAGRLQMHGIGHSIHQVITNHAGWLAVVVVGIGVGAFGCARRSASSWAQTAPIIAPSAPGPSIIHLGARRDLVPVGAAMPAFAYPRPDQTRDDRPDGD